MVSKIGFVSVPQIWDGPIQLKFSHYKDHTETVRYTCPIGSRNFDFFIPRIMFPDHEGELPQKVYVAIARAKENTAFNLFSAKVSRGEARLFGFDHPRVNSDVYVLRDKRRYSMYVPDEMFGAMKHPDSLVVQVAFPPSA